MLLITISKIICVVNVIVVCNMLKCPSKSNNDMEGSTRRRLANWTDSLDLIMRAIMRQANDEGHCQNGLFSKETWNRMITSFNQHTKKGFTYSNMKNRLKVLKKNFNLYYILANRFGWGWDLVLKVPTPSDMQMWDEVIAMSAL